MLPTDQVTIAGVTDTTYNGTFPIASIIDSLHFTYAQTNCQFVFERRHGRAGGLDHRGRASVRRNFRDAARLPDAAFAAGFLDVGRRNVRANVTGIPSVATLAKYRGAHSGVYRSGRRLCFTTRRAWTARRRCRCLTTARHRSSWIFRTPRCLRELKRIRFSIWWSSANAPGVIGYSERLFWWGERNKQNNWDNLTFDGGFGGAGNNVPLGWTPDATYFAGGSYDSTGRSGLGRRLRDPGRRRDGDARADDADRRERLQRRAAAAGEYRILGARARAHDGRADAGHAARAHLQRVARNFDHRHFRSRRANYRRRVEGIYRADHALGRLHDDSGGSGAARVCRRHAHARRGISGRQHRDFSHRRSRTTLRSCARLSPRIRKATTASADS